jgi:excisionase family DNA binding protein
MELGLQLPDEVVDAIARRAAELVLERLDAAAPAGEWLTIEEAAELLRCKPQRIYDLRSDGRLGRHSEGGRALVARASSRLVVDEDAAVGRPERLVGSAVGADRPHPDRRSTPASTAAASGSCSRTATSAGGCGGGRRAR